MNGPSVVFRTYRDPHKIGLPQNGGKSGCSKKKRIGNPQRWFPVQKPEQPVRHTQESDEPAIQGTLGPKKVCTLIRFPSASEPSRLFFFVGMGRLNEYQHSLAKIILNSKAECTGLLKRNPFCNHLKHVALSTQIRGNHH